MEYEVDRDYLYERIKILCNGGSVTPGQATRIRQVLTVTQRFEKALESIAQGDPNPIMLANRALGHPELCDPTRPSSA